MTSATPPAFDGSCLRMTPYECHAFVTHYLSHCKIICRLHGFQGDGKSQLFHVHPTYVDWISTGLSHQAFAKWQRIPDEERREFTWLQYATWIQTSFTFKRTYGRALLTSLKQERSVVDYSFAFNTLLETVEDTLEPLAQCTLYRKGLKPDLKDRPELNAIHENLNTLQSEAECLDALKEHLRYDSRNPPNMWSQIGCATEALQQQHAPQQ
ncbi:hypothetical protein HK405_000153 [Cladochytrium tenue]|nr:hypothetical protein HK405_000153 [Cladochytrium tenue]